MTLTVIPGHIYMFVGGSYAVQGEMVTKRFTGTGDHQIQVDDAYPGDTCFTLHKPISDRRYDPDKFQ
jgi:hypothetical protein